MNRREAIGRVGLLMGGVIIGTELFVSGCKAKNSPKEVQDLFAKENTDFMNEVADTILPDTQASPGAKAAGVGPFMAVMVRDCYTPEDQKIFIDGVKKIDEASQKQFGKAFVEASPEQRLQLLTALDKEQQDYTKKKKEKDPNHYFRMMKELTLLGYFTSEVGATKALRYLPIPGKYIGDYPYKKGDKAWALS